MRYNQLSGDVFVERSIAVHGSKYDYTLSVYNGYHNKLNIICPYHGVFEQRAKHHLKGYGCRKCGRDVVSGKLRTVLEGSEIEWLNTNYNKTSASKCAQKLGVNKKTITKILRRNGFESPSVKRGRNLYEEISIGFWNRLVNGANNRNLLVNITPKILWNIYLKQNKLCALSGVEISFSKKSKTTTASVDRIDSKKGYTEENVQIVHKTVNFMKMDLDQSEFIAFCSKISNKNKL